MKRTTIMLDEDHERRLREIAKKADITTSELIRIAIERFLRKRD